MSHVVWLNKWVLASDLEIICHLRLLPRCRAASASRGLRAAVEEAGRLGLLQPRVLAVAAGESHTVVCTGDAVFSFGSGGVGQLGYEAVSQSAPRMATGLLAEDVPTGVAASTRSTLVRTAGGRAYWSGRLYSTYVKSAVPRLVGGLEQVVGVAAGAEHLLAWTRSGELYTWGYGLCGQLGHGSTENEAAPRLVEGLAGQRVVGANGGLEHSVACTASGRVYSFGQGRARLGHGAGEHELTPRVVEGLLGSTVVSVAAGSIMTAVVTEAGELYTWGARSLGALGHGEGEEDTTVLLPRLVAGLVGKRVAGVKAGEFHLLAWTDLGELYSWGGSVVGEYGQLGHNSTQDEHSPRRVEALAGKSVVMAAGGQGHSVVVTQDSEIYTFGKGCNGQLGHGSKEGEEEPRQVCLDMSTIST